jgi:hypothetical protein
MPPALFALVILEIVSHFLPWSVQTSILLFILPPVAEMTNTHHNTQLFLFYVEMGSYKHLIWAGLNSDPPNLSITVS